MDGRTPRVRLPEHKLWVVPEERMRALYDELRIAQYERIADNDGVTPSCVCDPGDRCPACRTHDILAWFYEIALRNGRRPR